MNMELLQFYYSKISLIASLVESRVRNRAQGVRVARNTKSLAEPQFTVGWFRKSHPHFLRS
jgi:hypothetical protein